MLQHSSLYRQLSTTQAINDGKGSDNGEFKYPEAIVFDRKGGHLIVADCFNHRMQWFDRFTLRHLTSYEKPNRGIELGQFDGPTGLCLQPITNNLVVCDSWNNRVQVLSLDDIFPIPLFAIGRKPIINTDGVVKGSEKKGEFNKPRGVCCSPNEGIFIADTNNHRVQSFDAGGRFLSTFGKEGAGDQEFRSPRNICLVHPRFSPSSLASSLLCVADCWNQRVSVWNYNALSSSSPPQHVFNFKAAGKPYVLCVDLKGYLHVFSGHPSYVISIYDFRMTMMSSDNSNKRNNKREPALIQTLDKDGGKGIYCISGMCVDSSNTLMVVDRNNHQVHIFDESQY